MTGSCDRASQPIAEETTGTSRQPEHVLPLVGDDPFDRPVADQPLALAPGRNTNATP